MQMCSGGPVAPVEKASSWQIVVGGGCYEGVSAQTEGQGRG